MIVATSNWMPCRVSVATRDSATTAGTWPGQMRTSGASRGTNTMSKEVRQLAREVFAHRGQYGPRPARPDLVRPWLATTSGGRPRYRIDRKHPLVSELLRLAGDNVSLAEAALQVIEETVPVQRIWLDAAEKPDTHLLPFEDRTKTDVKRLIQQTYEACRAGGSTSEEALDQLRRREEFREYEKLIDEIED